MCLRGAGFFEGLLYFVLGFFFFFSFLSRKQNLNLTDIVHYGVSYNSHNSEISINLSSLDFFPYKTQKNNST